MDLIFNCPKCGQELEVDDSGAGEEINCPSCGEAIRIPAPQVAAAAKAESKELPKALGGWNPEGQPGSAINTSAAAKIKMHLKVPVHATPAEKLISKALVPLDVAAKTSDRQLRIKCIKHVDCVEVGHDRFDEMVTAYLTKVGEANVVSINTISYSHIDIGSQKLLNDFGVMIVYRG
ncbi:MAG: hypothetical protein JWR19_114 [Pedosphaera sp.]|nr:hypothetical protein [Pedosphaera sp.]